MRKLITVIIQDYTTGLCENVDGNLTEVRLSHTNVLTQSPLSSSAEKLSKNGGH